MKKIVIVLLLATSILTGCSKEESKIDKPIVDNNVEENENVEDIVVEYKGLNNIYTETKNINELDSNTELYNFRVEGSTYERQAYKEVDFAVDLINEYLNSNEVAYDALVMDYKDEDGKLIKADEYTINRSKESLSFLKETMGLQDSNKIYFKLSKITYNGKIDNKYTTSIDIDGHISSWDGGYYQLINYKVVVYEEENNLYAIII